MREDHTYRIKEPLLKEPVAAGRPRVFVPALLFLVTVVTTVTAGAFYEGVNPFTDPGGLVKGIPFSASLLVILGTHELGHYFASRLHNVVATLPFFIPAPPIPPLIGTFGAVIRMKSPIATKKALVDIGAAGPLSGFVVAVFVVIWGLTLSEVAVKPLPGEGFGIGLGSSIIFNILTHITVGPIPEGFDIYLHSVAFAGWIGLFVTALNLFPMGQLDGGHVVYALVGPIHRKVSIVMVVGLSVLGIFTWPGWLVWAALVTIIGIWHPPIQNQDVPMDQFRRALSFTTLVVFVLTFTPMPIYIY
jgi:membrane-associated protease RseP (regulator of RpoE activity)